MLVVAQELRQTGMDTPVIITDMNCSFGVQKTNGFETKWEDSMQVRESETDDNR